MSILIPIASLTDPQRVDILRQLTFRVENDRNPNASVSISTFQISQDQTQIAIPFAWAISNSYQIPSRSFFQSITYNFTGTLRPQQQQHIPEIIDTLNKSGSIILALHVGFGKSVMACYLMYRLKLPVLVIVKGIVLAKQWMEHLSKFFPDQSSQLLTSKTTTFTSNLYVVNFENVPKLPIVFLETIGTVIADEIHLLCSPKNFQGFFHLRPRYMIGMSATPYRKEQQLIDFYFGTKSVKCDLKRTFDVFVIYTGIQLAYERTFDGRLDWNSILTNQSENLERNQKIVDLICEHAGHFFLVLVKRVEHGELLKRMLEERGESVDDLLGNKVEFDREKRILIATVSKVGSGFSHDKLDALVLATDIEAYFIQSLGRVFRRETVRPMIIDFVDKMSVLEKHFATRKKVYKEIGAEFSEIKW